MSLPPVAVTGAGDQHDRLQLLEAREDGTAAELGGDDGPHGTDRRGGQQPDDRLAAVRQHGDDPVAVADALVPEETGDRGNLLAQL
jgi:hypothetical protein